ncbi:MAG: dihydrolipoyl dehydrogenase [Bacillota bacterium]|jgi:dihydrolipoamide dehydrogenase|nr:dihydrolipoyl dehydrogenase [Bacillota bacterium]HHT90165.1 dihydrolipoyl dehydrogenase [Bacillota bacterium]
MSHYQMAILGGGPGGYVAAIRAAQMGAKVVLIEGGELGGVCLNEGCIPTKTLLKSARVYQDIIGSEEYGIRLGNKGEVTIDWDAMLKRKDGVVGQLTSGVKGLLQRNGVDVVNGYGEIQDAQSILVNGQVITAQNLILATGSRAKILPIPGLESALKAGTAVTSTGALSLREIPQGLVIVGGGVVGIEFAALFNALGAKVTVLEKFTILNSLDADLQRYMLRTLRKKGVEIHEQCEIEGLEGSTVLATVQGETRAFPSDRVIVSLGRTPNVEALGRLGLAMDGEAVRTNARLETSIPGVYAIGDLNGKHMLAHVASAEGLVAVENIMGRKAEINYDKVPACIYSFPEVAVVGLTEQEALRRGHRLKMGTFPLAANGKALAEGEAEGFVKIVADSEYGEVLGVHIIAAQATDLISEAVATLELEGTVHDLAKAIHPHPTSSEIIMEAAQATIDQAIHFFRK